MHTPNNMTIYNTIKNELEINTSFRERRFKDTKLFNLTMVNLGFLHKWNTVSFTEDNMISFAKKFDSFRHEWGAVLLDHEELRGKDYGDKKREVQKKQIEYGYEGGFNQDITKKQ